MIINVGYVGDFPPIKPICVCFNSVDASGRPAPITDYADVALVRDGSPALIGDDTELSVNHAGQIGLNVFQAFADTGLPAGEYTIVMSAGVVDGNSVVGQIIGSFSVNR